MSNIVSLDDLKKQMQETLTSEEWQKFSTAQMQQLEAYNREIAILKQKNAQLEHLLKQKTPGLVQPLTPEEIICIEQIDRLRNASQTRELGLEEVKRLDLLVKNLKLIREGNTIVVTNNNQDKISEAELVAIIKRDSNSSGNTEGS